MKIPKVAHEGVLGLSFMKLRCYVLDDGSRVFDADDFGRLLSEGLAEGKMVEEDATTIAKFNLNKIK